MDHDARQRPTGEQAERKGSSDTTAMDPAAGTSRRSVLLGSAAAVAVVAVAPAAARWDRFAARATDRPILSGPGAVPITLSVNGSERRIALEPRVTLLDALRERLELPGTRKGCNQGACGACTVLVDDRPVNACLELAVRCEGRAIRTIEGVGSDGDLHPLQQAFVEHDAFQCGYCTSGQMMTGIALLASTLPESEAELAEALSGNLCRCAAYPQIRAAVRSAAADQGGA